MVTAASNNDSVAASRYDKYEFLGERIRGQFHHIAGGVDRERHLHEIISEAPTRPLSENMNAYVLCTRYIPDIRMDKVLRPQIIELSDACFNAARRAPRLSQADRRRAARHLLDSFQAMQTPQHLQALVHTTLGAEDAQSLRRTLISELRQSAPSARDALASELAKSLWLLQKAPAKQAVVHVIIRALQARASDSLKKGAS